MPVKLSVDTNGAFKITMSRTLIPTTRIYLSISSVFFLSLWTAHVLACATNAECGTCIKQEKRGQGICYGRELGDNSSGLIAREANFSPSWEPIQQQISIAENLGSDEPIYGEEGYVEPNVQPRIIDRLDVQETGDSACVTSGDCAGGQECIYRDPMLGHGLCETPPG